MDRGQYDLYFDSIPLRSPVKITDNDRVIAGMVVYYKSNLPVRFISYCWALSGERKRWISLINENDGILCLVGAGEKLMNV